MVSRPPPMNAVPRPDQESLSFARLGQSTAAPRVLELLDGIWRTAWPLIGAALQRGLDELQSDLFGHAERAPNVNEQNHCFDALRELRQKQAEFIERSCDGMQRSLLHLIDDKVALDELSPGESVGRRTELSLVDPVRFEEILVLTQIGTRAEMRAAEELHALAYRQAAIVGGAPAELIVANRQGQLAIHDVSTQQLIRSIPAPAGSSGAFVIESWVMANGDSRTATQIEGLVT